jgi:hypothetical protein
MESIENISFDESDQNLFQVDDARLRADALKFSILPRLHVLMNECIAAIRNIYDIEVLEDSIISFYPHFRPKRDNELTLLYDAAYVGLGGKRVKNKWLGVERKDNKPVQFLPFRFGFQLTETGLSLLFENQWLKGLSDDSFAKYLNFHLEFEELTHRLCYLAEMQPFLFYGNDVKPVSTFKQQYRFMLQEKIFENSFVSQHSHKYPIFSEELDLLVNNYIYFYPVYDSYVQISKGQPIRFLELIEKLNNWLITIDEENSDENDFTENLISEEALLAVKQAAEQKVKVMPAIRWQVFQRDNWRCVSCGRGSQHDVILHIDHIIPRSKGGKDELENYQTLCETCNIGKSNKDDTNLRNYNAI